MCVRTNVGQESVANRSQPVGLSFAAAAVSCRCGWHPVEVACVIPTRHTCVLHLCVSGAVGSIYLQICVWNSFFAPVLEKAFAAGGVSCVLAMQLF